MGLNKPRMATNKAAAQITAKKILCPEVMGDIVFLLMKR
jgi:hypothetical protein